MCILIVLCIIARAGGLSIFILHILGDLISPPIIGYISDRTHSLQTGLQVTWIAVIVTGLYWFAGYYFLPALPLMNELTRDNTTQDEKADHSLTYREAIGGDCCLHLPPVINLFGEDAILNPVTRSSETDAEVTI